MTGSCERDIESPGSIQCGKFLDQLKEYQLLKKDSMFHGAKYLTQQMNSTTVQNLAEEAQLKLSLNTVLGMQSGQ